MDRFPLMVPGAKADPEPLQVDAPFDGQIIAEVETGNADVVERALATAHALYRDRDAWLPAPQRIAILKRAAEIMQERRDELAMGAWLDPITLTPASAKEIS